MSTLWKAAKITILSLIGLVVEVLIHTFDHYGQMVEYLRMNGIVPPASRLDAGGSGGMN